MTTNSELIDQAMGRLGGRTSTRLRADLVSEVNTTIDNFEQGTFIPWFLEATATLDIVADDTFVTLPEDFAIEADEITTPGLTPPGSNQRRFAGQSP